MKGKKEVLVNKFGKTKKVKALVYGDPKKIYEGKSLIWMERSEDWYGLDWYIENRKNFCVITREDFLNGDEIN